jgi:hypothetical protein
MELRLASALGFALCCPTPLDFAALHFSMHYSADKTQSLFMYLLEKGMSCQAVARYPPSVQVDAAFWTALAFFSVGSSAGHDV